jgi:hypothetical protein
VNVGLEMFVSAAVTVVSDAVAELRGQSAILLSIFVMMY